MLLTRSTQSNGWTGMTGHPDMLSTTCLKCTMGRNYSTNLCIW